MAEFENEITCRDLVEVATDYLEDALSFHEALVIERHLGECDGCRRYLEQMRVTVKVLGKLREEDVPDEMRERLLGAFRELKRL